MKNIFITLTILFYINHCYSQSYYPFPMDSAIWDNITTYDDLSNWHGPEYQINGEDTLINGMTYKKLFEFPSYYLGGIREDSLKKIYFIRKDSTREYLLYDFSLSAGDTTWVWRSEYQEPDGLYRFIITGEDSVLLDNGEYRRALEVSNRAKWIEGIGGTGGLLFDGRSDLKIVQLSCFYHKGQVVICTDVGIEKTETTNTKFTISPNPFSSFTTIQIEGVQGNDLQMKLYDIFGKVVYSTHRVCNSHTLHRELLETGIYFLEVIKEQEVLGIKKVVIK